MKTIIEKLEENAQKFPDKIVYEDVECAVSYKDFLHKAKVLATKLTKYNLHNKPIAVFDNRNVNTLIGMFAIMISGNFYVVIDSKSPVERIEKIYSVLETNITVCETENIGTIPEKYSKFVETYAFDEEINETKLKDIYDNIISTDPAYILFTSGSTGVPKGTVLSHQNIMCYIEWFSSEFDITPKTVFGSQTAFYFSASVSDIFSTVYTGATFKIIPKQYFSFPIKLMEFLNEKQVNTIYWVPSALCIVANFKLFDFIKPLTLKKVLFIGEPMPNKQLNYWRRLEGVKFYNLFGPTETTDVCTFYEVNRPFKDDESLPIGKHCNNCHTFIVDENGKEVVEENVVGELYVRGPFLAYGYYNNKEKTNEAFVQNPLQNSYPELVYKTGDLVKLNKYGEYECLGRKDFQIKHMGYRIELGEIENATFGIENIQSAVCVYDKGEDVIVLLYVGRVKEELVLEALTHKVPNYMVPNIILRVPQFPFNANGKIDRKWLMSNYKTYISEGK